MKAPLFIVICFLFICFGFNNGYKELDLNEFKITVPIHWKYKKLQGGDSFIGEITGPKTKLFFDCSSRGYANDLMSTQEQYVMSEEWIKLCLFCKAGVTYTASWDVKKVRESIMKEKGITDTNLVKVEAFPNYEMKILSPTLQQKQKFPKADFIAKLTSKDSVITIPIEIPSEIKSHNIKIDTTNQYIIKTIYPKTFGRGMTGIYIKKLNSSFNFQMNGNNLPRQQQEQALAAFKTIKFR